MHPYAIVVVRSAWLAAVLGLAVVNLTQSSNLMTFTDWFTAALIVMVGCKWIQSLTYSWTTLGQHYNTARERTWLERFEHFAHAATVSPTLVVMTGF